jgi:hypothetical protein
VRTATKSARADASRPKSATPSRPLARLRFHRPPPWRRVDASDHDRREKCPGLSLVWDDPCHRCGRGKPWRVVSARDDDTDVDHRIRGYRTVHQVRGGMA